MKKALLVVFVLLAVASFCQETGIQSESIVGKVVKITGEVSGMGIVTDYRENGYIQLRSIDERETRTILLKDINYHIQILADSREEYLELKKDGMIKEDQIQKEIVRDERVERQRYTLPLAEKHLASLATRARSQRMTSALTSILLGGVVGGIGIYAIAEGGSEGDQDMETMGDIFLGAGALLCGLGALDLAVKSRVERDYDEALTLSPQQRETYCAEALESLARSGATSRYIQAGIMGVLSIVFFAAQPMEPTDFWGTGETFDWNIYWGIGFAVDALMTVIIRTPAEIAYDSYLAEKASYDGGARLSLNLRPVRRGVALSLNLGF